MEGKILILAPHPDDEVIGCFELIKEKPEDIIVVWFDEYAGMVKNEEVWQVRMLEAEAVASKFGFEYQVFFNVSDLLENVEDLIRDNNVVAVLVPDLGDEHEHHRLVNSAGYIIAKEYGLRFGEYTTRMNTEYVRESKYPEEKLEAIKMYKSQSWLWEIGDAKWWLFEGRVWYD